MKKLFLLSFTALLFANTTAVAQKKVALTTFWVSKHIGFEQLGGGVGLAAAIASLSDDPNFNLKPVLDNFYKTFTEEYAQSFPFELMAKEDVVNRAEYLGSMFTVRTVLPNLDNTDARPTIVRKLKNNIISIFSGKIGNCIQAADEVEKIIEN